MTLLTFIIPVRHPDNSKNWPQAMRHLQETAASIANQSFPDWSAIVVANAAADIPALPGKFDVERVDFPPNPRHDPDGLDVESFRDAFRLDKGRRVLAGLFKARQSGFIMIVDDDDFVSNRLAEFAAARKSANGWVVEQGYVWDDGGNIVYCHKDFSALCGTSHIVRTELYKLPRSREEASDTYVKQMLGSHRFIAPHLASAGTPLDALPFPGAIYRVGHAGAHSRSSTVLQSFVFNRGNLRRPYRVPRHLARLRLVSPGMRREFFGPDGERR